MAKYCGVCGTSIGGGKFCPKCGAPQTQARTAPARNGFPTIKAVFVILALMLLMGVAGVLGALYWAKGKVEEAAHSEGAESLRAGAATLRDDAAKMRDAVSSAANAEPTRAGCDILSKEKVAAILHSPVASVQGNDAGDIKEYCNYTPFLEVQAFRGTAKVALISLKAASLVTGQEHESIQGPWDEAYFGPFDSVFFVRTGNNGLMLKLTHIPHPREKALALAQAMLKNL
jgi:hypothetical protein